MSSDILITIVNQKDEPVGAATITEARQKGLMHRVSRIMVEDEEGRILLQRRSSNMRSFPSCWDNSAAGHVDEGETYEQAAIRELQEEIGIAVDEKDLQAIGYYEQHQLVENLQLNRFNRVFKVLVTSDATFKLQQEEVSAVQWVTLEHIRTLLRDQPDSVTDGIIDVINRFYS